MKFANLPLLQICIVFFLGVWIGFTNFEVQLSAYVLITSSLFVLLTGSFFIAKRYAGCKLLYTISALLFIFSLGLLNTKIHLPEYQKRHYTHLIAAGSIKNELVTYTGKVIKPLKSSAYKDKYEIDLQSISGKEVSGKALVQLPVSEEVNLRSNFKVSGIGSISAFKSPSNPQQFNYKEYMATQQMSHVIDSDALQITFKNHSGFSFIGFGEKARAHIQSSLKSHEFTKDQMDIIQALLLGQKQEIDPETYDRFSKAGVVHILAVSGLHVGIILLILQFITKGFLRVKFGRILRASIVLLGIWGFATLAGYSPSVLRAAVMFSFLSIALNYRRKTSAINTLALSAIFLLMVNPFYIYQVGFQLSYLAVLSIVSLQPKLSKLYQPKFFLDQKIWDIITVTLTAQIGVLPLSLYYFHQFPGLFLISNLFILPGLGILLGGGIMLISLSLLGILPEILVSAYGSLLNYLLSFVDWVATKEEFILSDIYFTKSMLVSSMLLLFSIIFWDYKNKMRAYVILNLSLLVLLFCFHFEKRKQLQQEEVVIFQTYKNTQLGILKGSVLKLYSDELQPKDSIKSAYHIKNYKGLKGIDTIQLSGFRNVYELNSSEFLFILDSIPVYPESDFKPDYIFLKNSPDINLDRVLVNLKPKQIIADGSNYKSDIELWKASARKLNINFHSTWENGAFIFPKTNF